MEKFKKWWNKSNRNKVAIIVAILLIAIGGYGASMEKQQPVADSDSSASETQEKEHNEESDSTTDEIEKVLSKFSPKDVYNDETCHWYLSTIVGNVQMEEIAREYVSRFVKDSADIHFVVNLSLKTTSVVYDMPALGLIDISVYEYVDKEEHYSEKLATGMKLAEYHVNKETGEIEKVD